MRIALAITLTTLLAACGPRIQEPGPGAAAPMLAADHILTRDGLRLPLDAWRPEGKATAIALALHGFNDYRRAFATVGPRLARDGIAVYAYDQRGFGAAPQRGFWPGADRLLHDFADAAMLLRQRYPDRPIYGLGESMGGAVIMAGMAEGMTTAIDGAILAAPAVWGRRTMPEIQAWFLDLFAHVMPAVAGKNQGLDFTPSDNIEMLRGLGRDPLVIKETRIDAIYGLVNLMDQALAAAPSLRAPTLILLGARDDIIESGPSCAMLRDLPSGAARAWRAALYPRGYHMLLRDLQAETVLADVAAWMTARTAPLPSGAELPPDRIDTACRSR